MTVSRVDVQNPSPEIDLVYIVSNPLRDGNDPVISSTQPRLIDSQDRLDGWKDIAAYLGRNERTVRRWEEREGLPVHRHTHDKRSSVYAYRLELEHWLSSRAPEQEEAKESPAEAGPVGNETLPQSIAAKSTSRLRLTGTLIAVLVMGGLGAWLIGRPGRRAGPDAQSRVRETTHRTNAEAMVAYQ